MARISRSELTKMEIVHTAAQRFLEDGYSSTTISSICKELEMSTGNLTFHFPTKEHLLAELVDMLCVFQWKLMDEVAQEGYSSLMAVCLELVAMASMCEEDEVARDFYISAYTSSLCLEAMRRNDAKRAKEVFGPFCPGWTDKQFSGAETLVSGIEYGTLMVTNDCAPLQTRIEAALNAILMIYNVPEEIRAIKVAKALNTDYKSLGRRVLKEFKEYVESTTEQAFYDILKERCIRT